MQKFKIMKIICIGRNYIDHAKELKNEVPENPLFFLKPDSSILPKRNPFYIPNQTYFDSLRKTVPI